MTNAFQRNAFQNTAFQTNPPAVIDIVDTDILQLPINCVLIGEQLYERTGRTFEKIPGRSGSRTIARAGQGVRLAGDAPSFSVKTNSKGYS